MQSIETMPNVNQILHHSGKKLYRSESSGRYYALFKRDGKQIRPHQISSSAI